MIIMKNKTVTNSPDKSSGSNGQVWQALAALVYIDLVQMLNVTIA